MLVLDMSFRVDKPPRTSHFNFKDPGGQVKFFNLTDKNTKLSTIFSTKRTFTDQVSMFEKTMNGIYQQAFPKIREKKRKSKEDDIGHLIEKRKKLKTNPISAENETEIDNIEDKILNIFMLKEFLKLWVA